MDRPQFQPIVVTTSSDDRQVLETIAKTLVDQKFAACVQISGPIASHYVWNDQHQCSNEWTCAIKTSMPIFLKIKRIIDSLHNYETPQLIAVEIVEASDSYLKWMQENLTAS